MYINLNIQEECSDISQEVEMALGPLENEGCLDLILNHHVAYHSSSRVKI